MRLRDTILCTVVLTAVLAGCGDDSTASPATADDRPTIVVTTNILGDVVTDLVGDAAEVEVVMPRGSDPHDFQASARQVDQMRGADALITNGADFEIGLHDAIEALEADGVATYAAIDGVDALELAGEDHDHDDADHEQDAAHEEDDEHAKEEDHHHDGVDPHFFTDPSRMADAAAGISAFLADELPSLATDEVAATADAYVADLRALDLDVEEILSTISPDDRVLITNHEVFGYFADRYDFEVIGTVIPGGTTGGEASAGELTELAELIETEGVPAIFADTSSPAQLAEALAAEAGDVEVVELFSESLGDDDSGAATYVEMVTTNAQRISDALS